MPEAGSSNNPDHEDIESTNDKVPMSKPVKLARWAIHLGTVEARTLARRARQAGGLRLNLHVQRKELARAPGTSEGRSESAESGLRHTMWSKLTIETALIHYCNGHHVLKYVYRRRLLSQYKSLLLLFVVVAVML